jgi:hypothetical protein
MYSIYANAGLIFLYRVPPQVNKESLAIIIPGISGI